MLDNDSSKLSPDFLAKFKQSQLLIASPFSGNYTFGQLEFPHLRPCSIWFYLRYKMIQKDIERRIKTAYKNAPWRKHELQP